MAATTHGSKDAPGSGSTRAGVADRDRDARLPAFSVIIPTFDRPRQLAECLASLAELRPPPGGFEVIVVDDGSSAPVDGLVEGFRSPLDISLVRRANAGPGTARNVGADRARGEFLAFSDDDCRPDPRWLQELAAGFRLHPTHLIGGTTRNGLPESACSTTSQLILDTAYAHYNRDPDGPLFFASNNMAVPAEAFRKVGGFDERFPFASEDREFCDRWRHLGHGMSVAPDAVVVHLHRLGLRGFCRQHLAYGRGARRYHAARARRGSGRLRDDLVFHLRFLGLLRAPMRELPFGLRIRVGALLVLWQVLNAVGFTAELWRAPGAGDD